MNCKFYYHGKNKYSSENHLIQPCGKKLRNVVYFACGSAYCLYLYTGLWFIYYTHCNTGSWYTAYTLISVNFIILIKLYVNMLCVFIFIRPSIMGHKLRYCLRPFVCPLLLTFFFLSFFNKPFVFSHVLTLNRSLTRLIFFED